MKWWLLTVNYSEGTLMKWWLSTVNYWVLRQMPPRAPHKRLPTWARVLVRWPFWLVWENYSTTPAHIPGHGDLLPGRRLRVWSKDVGPQEAILLLDFDVSQLQHLDLRFSAQHPCFSVQHQWRAAYAAVLFTVAAWLWVTTRPLAWLHDRSQITRRDLNEV